MNTRETIQVIGKTLGRSIETSRAFSNLQLNSYESKRLIGMYSWPPEGLGLGLEIVVADQVFQTHFEQSASGIGRYVETLRSFRSVASFAQQF